MTSGMPQNIKTRTLLYYDKLTEQHEKPEWMVPPEVHQENSCRTRLTMKVLCVDNAQVFSRLQFKNGRDATDDELQLVHSAGYISQLQNTTNMHPEQLKHFRSQFDDIYISPGTWAAAIRAAGAAIDLVQEICRTKDAGEDGVVTNGMSLMRPPGHHAGPNYAQGFCYLNSTALAAKYAVERLGLQRVMIVDWDVHFGNGTQHIFYDDARVLHISIHRYQDATFWPFLNAGDVNFVGSDAGVGKNVNIPLNTTGCGYAEYNAIFEQIITPMAREFLPELIIVACGFDAGRNDPEGQMCLDPQDFACLTTQLMQLQSRVALILEGGYNIPLVADSTVACLCALLGDIVQPTASAGDKKVREIVHHTIDRVKRMHAPYWKCFAGENQIKGDFSSEEKSNFSYKTDFVYRKIDCPSDKQLPENWTPELQSAVKRIDEQLRQQNY